MQIRTAAAFVTAGTLLCAPHALAAPAALASGSSERCTALGKLDLGNAKVTSATHVASTAAMVGYCEVAVTFGDQMDILVRLPDAWKGRYLQQGGGGFDGTLSRLSAPPGSATWSAKNPLNEGYAVAGSNGGHRDSDFPGASFSADRGMVLSYAGAKIYDTDRIGHEIVERYYGMAPRYRYFAGCSNGGRNASVAAAYFSDNFDGVIGGAGVWGVEGDAPGSMAGHVAKWVSTSQVTPRISQAKGAAVVAAQVAQCDHLDGKSDGVINSPSTCGFDPRTLICKPGQAADSCLTPAEATAITTYRSSLTINGKSVGSAWGLGDPSRLAGVGGLASGHLGLLAGTGKDVAAATFDVPSGYAQMKAYFEGTLHMTGDLNAIRSYLSKGKKLILFHGWDDTIVPPYNSVNFYEALTKGAGPTAANARLYMQPGVGHCGGGSGPDQAELLFAMTSWVEEGKAPSSPANPVETWKRDQPASTKMPLCPYPSSAVFGNGAWQCTSPRRTTAMRN